MPADHPRTTLSPREAACLTGVGRSSVMRAIADGTLPARRDNRNQWRIEQAALDRWQADRGPARTPDRTMPAARPEPGRAASADHTETALELAAARATIAQLEARLEDRASLVRAAEDRTRAVEVDRDRWRELADKLTDRLAERPASSPDPAPMTRPRRWWPWARG